MDVALEERTALLVELGRRGRGAEVARRDRRAGALERAVDRRDARVEELRDFGRLPAQDLTEDQHRALARRQMLQGRDEREPDRLARESDFRRIAVGHDEAVRDGLDPRHLRQRVQVRLDRLPGWAEVHRPCTPLAAVQHVEADVRRDAIEPRPQCRTALESIEAPPGADQRLLDGVLGLEGRSQHPVAVAGQLRPVLLEPLLQRLLCRFDGHRPTAILEIVCYREES